MRTAASLVSVRRRDDASTSVIRLGPGLTCGGVVDEDMAEMDEATGKKKLHSRARRGELTRRCQAHSNGTTVAAMARRGNSPSKSRAPIDPYPIEKPRDVLERATTELEWYDALAALVPAHGEVAMRQVAKEFLSRSQVNECFARLKQRSQRLAWVRCSCDDDGALTEISILLTDTDLNEVDRCTVVLGSLAPDLASESAGSIMAAPSLSGASELIVTFLEEHCARKTAVVAGSSLGDDVAILKQDLPTVHAFLVTNAPIDVGRGGTARYAKLRARGLVPETKAALSSWESEHRAAQEQSDASSIDYLEASVVALGESRERFVARSKAAKYVAAALYATMALLLAVSAKLVVLVATDEV